MIILGYYNKATYYKGTTPIKCTYAGNRIYVDDANPGTEDAVIFTPNIGCVYTYIKINSINPNQTLYYSTNGQSWTECTSGKSIPLWYLGNPPSNAPRRAPQGIGGGPGQGGTAGGGRPPALPLTIYLRGAVVNNVSNPSTLTNITIYKNPNVSAPDFRVKIKGKLRNLIGTISEECCKELFKGSAYIKDASELELPNTVKQSCYESMFENCTDLEIGPTLPATTLANSCYKNMFKGCTKLNHIVCNATDISATDCTTDWVNGVASSGLFERNENNNSWTIGVNGIPTNWTVQPPLGVPNDEIWYTSSTNGKITVLQAYLNATIVSHTYVDGKGVIKFDSDLTDILDGNNLHSYYNGAFTNGNASGNLSSIFLPGSLSHIGNYAFYRNDDLTNIKYNGTKSQWNGVTKSSSWNLHMPATVVHCTDGDVSI